MTDRQLQPPKRKLPALSAASASSTRIPGSLGWRLLRLLNGYRMALAVLLAAVVAISANTGSTYSIGLGATNAVAFLMLCGSYIAAAALLAGLYHSRSPELKQQALAHLLTDATMICLLTAMSGGVRSGLAVLLLFSLGTCAMIMSRGTSLASAAFITLSLFATELFSSIISSTEAALPQTGILCSALFAMAWLTPRFARRVEQLEVLISQSSEDIARLQQINAEVVSQLDDGIVTVDARDRVELCNDAALKLLNGKRPRYHSPLFDLSPALEHQLTDWRRDAPSSAARYPQRYKLSFRAVDARMNQGNAVLILQDLSEQHRQVHQTKLAAMGRLTASIAHEIRNPLSAIKQASQLLQEAPALQGDDQNARLLDMVQRHSDRINGIIESVMQLSSSRQAAPKLLNLKAEVNAAIREHCEASDITAQQLTVDIGDPLWVEFDHGQLQQILANLINNAARHAQPLSADVAITFNARTTDTTIQLLVSDNGIGLHSDSGDNTDPTESTERFFEPFYSRDSRSRGSGLGLFICRQLAQANDGALHYEMASPPTPHAFVLDLKRLPPPISTATGNNHA